jgi:hypothetical protein
MPARTRSRTRTSAGGRRNPVQPSTTDRQRFPFHARASRCRHRKLRMEIADEVHRSAQTVRERAPQPVILRQQSEHAHPVLDRAQTLEATLFPAVRAVVGNRHVVAATDAFVEDRVEKPQILRGVPHEEHPHRRSLGMLSDVEPRTEPGWIRGASAATASDWRRHSDVCRLPPFHLQVRCAEV